MSTAPHCFDEADLIPLSGLQHVLFCERQFALIHVEQVWMENSLTLEGRQLHERVDETGTESRGEVRTARAVPMRSFRLGISGRADVVEFHRDPAGVSLARVVGSWRPFPVEYKRGKPKSHRADEVQLCAQGLCLEEMFSTSVPCGALFYGSSRRRLEIEFDRELRELVHATARRAHEILSLGVTPRAAWAPKCDQCSLFEACQPKAVARSASRFIAAQVRVALQDEGTP
jgi:CRISPR-associated exonuclease Cas4